MLRTSDKNSRAMKRNRQIARGLPKPRHASASPRFTASSRPEAPAQETSGVGVSRNSSTSKTSCQASNFCNHRLKLRASPDFLTLPGSPQMEPGGLNPPVACLETLESNPKRVPSKKETHPARGLLRQSAISRSPALLVHRANLSQQPNCALRQLQTLQGEFEETKEILEIPCGTWPVSRLDPLSARFHQGKTLGATSFVAYPRGLAKRGWAVDMHPN